MKTFATFASVAAAGLLFAGQAVANPEFFNHDNYGSILQQLDQPGSSGGSYEPTGHLVGVIASTENYGSVLYDLDQPSSVTLASPPSIGDDADDYGNILYDTGSVY